MTKCIPYIPVSLDEIINNYNGRCVIINCDNFGLLRLGTGLDSVGDVISVVYETDDYDKWMTDRICIWHISEASEGYYLINERDPGKEFYLFRGADLDKQGDYTIYGESEWHDDRHNRAEFEIWKKPVEHGAPPVPISYFIKTSSDGVFGRDYYLKSSVAKDRWDLHQVYASPKQTNDRRDEWFLFPVP